MANPSNVAGARVGVRLYQAKPGQPGEPPELGNGNKDSLGARPFDTNCDNGQNVTRTSCT